MRRMFRAPEASAAPHQPRRQEADEFTVLFPGTALIYSIHMETLPRHSPRKLHGRHAGWSQEAPHRGPHTSFLHSFIPSLGPGVSLSLWRGPLSTDWGPTLQELWLLHNLVLNHHGKFYQGETKRKTAAGLPQPRGRGRMLYCQPGDSCCQGRLMGQIGQCPSLSQPLKLGLSGAEDCERPVLLVP